MLQPSEVDVVSAIVSGAAPISAPSASRSRSRSSSTSMKNAVARAPLRERPLLPRPLRLDRAPGERPERPRVQVGVAVEDGQLGADLLERHAIAASTGGWSERT